MVKTVIAIIFAIVSVFVFEVLFIQIIRAIFMSKCKVGTINFPTSWTILFIIWSILLTLLIIL